MPARRNVAIAVLAVIPIGLYCVATVLREFRGPYHIGANSDPDYAYLFNSLNIVSLRSPDLIEHPGTTLEMLGAAAIVARWLPSFLQGASNIQDAVLANPEAYLTAISTVIAILVSVAAFVAGLQAFRTWGGILPALAIQVSLLLFTQIPEFLPKVTPDPLLIVAGLILIATLIPLVFAVDAPLKTDLWLAAWVGAAMGFGVATKFTFLPLLGFLLLLHGWARKAVALLACGFAFIVFTAPIVPKYAYLFEWVRALATHKGLYGSGDIGLPDQSALLDNVSFLFSVAAPLFFLLLLYVCLFVVLRVWNVGLTAADVVPVRRLALITCLVLVVQIAITAKHPGAHYLLPSMVMCGLMNAVAVLLVIRAAPKGPASLVGRVAVVAALLGGAFMAGGKEYDLAKAANAYAESRTQVEKQIEAKQGFVVAYYGSSLLTYALAFGNDFAADRYNNTLQGLYPNAFFYSIWERRFYSFGGDMPNGDLNRLLSGGRPVLMNGLVLTGSYEQYQAGLTLEPVLIGSGEAVYRLIRIESPK